ncbi:unnamed protein product, partial [Rotaria magnacalcarata]
TTVLLPSPDQTAATFVTKSSTENSDHSIVSLDSSNNDDMVESEGDADVFLNVPVVKGEITSGTSIRKESGLHKTRRRALPPVPRDQKFVVPPVYLETYSKEPFLIYDKRKSQYGGRVMMFASPEQLDVLFHSDILFADGTFRVSPILFEQLYVLLGMQHGEGV